MGIEPATKKAIALAADLLRQGRLVAFPTETVYGLGADAANGLAVAAVFEAKGRPRFNPLIVHVADLAAAERLAILGPLARRLAEAFWPGALTLVLEKRRDAPVSALVTAGLDTIALRAPSHPVARALLDEFGGPIAAPSANISGALSPTEAEHVEKGLDGKVALILDAGACPLGLESTIAAAIGERVVLLRPGAVPRADIERVIGAPLAEPEPSPGEAGPSAPGQLASHYAPRARLRLDATTVEPGEMLLAFGPDAPKGAAGLNLSPSGDLLEAAANLFAYLHILDETGVATIAVMAIPAQGVGEAINDRLRRAAYGR